MLLKQTRNVSGMIQRAFTTNFGLLENNQKWRIVGEVLNCGQYKKGTVSALFFS